MIKTGIVLIHCNLLFPCINSPESAACHVTGINNEKKIVCLSNTKSPRAFDYFFRFNLCKYHL